MSDTVSIAGELELSWLPGWADHDLERTIVRTDAGVYTLTRPPRAAWPRVANGLRRAQATLIDMPVAQIVDAVGATAERWCDRSYESRLRARDAVAAASGFSDEIVDRSFDVELRNYRGDSLWRMLRRELGDPDVLDRPTYDANLQGLARAVGTGVVVELLSGNVPGLPALGMVRALLSKSGLIAKVASAEPTFAAAFARDLNEADPRLGDALVVTYWERDDIETRDAVFATADTIVAYGSQDAVATAHAATRADQRFVEHGHRLSVGILTRAFLARAGHNGPAAAVARDLSMFNQCACIAPQAYLVEGTADEVARFGDCVSVALSRYARECPRGPLRGDEAAALQLRRAELQYSAAGSATRRVWAGRDWLVSLDSELGGAAGGRMLRLVRIADLDAAIRLLRPHRAYLQNVAVGAVEHEMPGIVEALARCGAARICAPGAMPDPSLTWRHDGRPVLADLVRWCDVEMHPWSEEGDHR